MILGRIISNLRQQNWTSLTLELMVLVIGIFLGLQVEGWNQDRKDRVAETRLVGYLITDLEKTINHLEGAISFLNKNSTAGRKTLGLLKNENLPNEDVEDFEKGINGVGKILSPDSFLVSFEQTNFAILMDPSLKRTVRTYLATVRSINGIIVHIRERMNGAMTLVSKRAYVGPDNISAPLVLYDFESLKQDQEFKIAFMSSIGMSDEAISQFKDILDISKNLLIYLKNHQTQKNDELNKNIDHLNKS